MTPASHPVVDPTSEVEAMLASGTQLVTFDVFDTLLWRTTLFPHDVFLLLGKKPGQSIAAARRFAEKVASVICRKVLRREPALSDVYRLLPFSMQQELALEARVCVPNPFCLRLVNSLHRRKIPIAAISDMYLSSDQIARLLDGAGYPQLPVYSSASEHATKFSHGQLFTKVWQRHRIAPSDVLHVGDNIHADVAMAARLGAQACHVGTPRSVLLKLHPKLDRPMKSGDESIYWGTLALRLHTYTPALRHQQCVPDELVAVLADIVSAASAGKPLALDHALTRLEAEFHALDISKEQPGCSR